MEFAEEQAEEVEALEAIFEEEFHLEDPPSETTGARFRVNVSEGDARVRLSFAHPPDYPASATSVTVLALDGVSAPQRRALQTALAQSAADAVPGPAAYTVCDAAREWLAAADPSAGEDEEEDVAGKFETIDAAAATAVERVAAKALGTPVTPESFAEWATKFRTEMEEKKGKVEVVGEKMTGRAMFEAKMADVGADAELWELEADAFDDAEG